MRRQKSTLRNKNLLTFALFISVVGSSLYFYSHKQNKPEKIIVQSEKTQSVYPTQYSDKNITENAKVSDDRFKNIAFLDTESMLGNAISSIDTSSGNINDNKPEKGTWLWTPILDITPQYVKLVILGAKKNNVRNVYLSIDSYLDIYVMPDGETKSKKKKAFDDTVENIIKTAKENGMTVDAEAGWRNWAEDGHAYKPIAMLSYAINFNKNHQDKFRGFQYDIEPYLLPEYKKDKKTVLTNFLSLVNRTVSRLDKSDLELSVVIPEFYDGTNNETPKFSWRGQGGYAIDHLLSVLDRRIGSKIIIMSYRNWSQGKNGSIDISRDEILDANKHQTKIVIAQETGDVLPSYVTFYGTSHSYYEGQVSAIENTFKSEKSFAGIATHYVNSLMTLK